MKASRLVLALFRRGTTPADSALGKSYNKCMKLSVLIEKLEKELALAGDKEVSAVELPPLPEEKAEDSLCLDFRYDG